MWFAHRLNDWSKLAKERVKKATESTGDSPSLSERTSTSSDDNLTPKDIQKSANSSFEVKVHLPLSLNSRFFFLLLLSLLPYERSRTEDGEKGERNEKSLSSCFFFVGE